MLSFFQIFLIAFGVAIDCFSVSACGGVSAEKTRIFHALKVASFFGITQGVMPILGWVAGDSTRGILTGVDHWIAFTVFAVIGIKIIKDAFESKRTFDIVQTKTLLLLSLATSIDAFVIGLSLSLLNVPLFLTAGIIALVTFVLSFVGFIFGRQLGIIFGKKIEVVGGFVLISIGFNILLTHLF